MNYTLLLNTPDNFFTQYIDKTIQKHLKYFTSYINMGCSQSGQEATIVSLRERVSKLEKENLSLKSTSSTPSTEPKSSKSKDTSSFDELEAQI